ncbi:MAG TPA: serine/threonine-protein kinase, partial [Planctomycetia bacterium]|nr:serine/threonine-protein kinase [Planctomycetia bacterium]
MSGSIADIKSIFGRALELESPAEREAFLAKACAGDAALRAEVESLLQAGLGAGDFLEDLRPSPDTTLYQSAGERPGDAIGPYKLLEQIGEGGFGAVYMAEQLEPVRRKVALKLLKPGMEARQVIARFEAERQALALMDHPNIAKVHDGGTTSAGRPYFVMELVRGTPISEHCDREQLTMRPRLELFIQVCMAVQHAHQKGIIHRDLKPSNVLVAMHDGAPVAKVIDFGVAKALGAELTDKTLFTGLAQMIGTPLYMSPEQAGRDGLDVDTRSDIYSLGVLLYELLTGTTPISKDRFKRAAFEEIRRIIREEDPPKPSTRLTESTDSLPSISAVRGTEPARLTKSLRGDLDWIAMKALEKNRERRYATAAGFALDIQRYLANEPVSAGPPSAWYRLRKFARRNRGSLAFAALAGAAAALAVIGLTVNHRMVSREKGEKEAALERVTEEKKRADENLATARRAVNQYLHRAVDDPLLKTADFQKLRKGLLEATLPFYQEFVRQRHEDPELERERGQAFLDLSMLRGALGEQARALEDALAAERLFGALARDPAAQPAIRNDWAGAIMTRGILLEEATR